MTARTIPGAAAALMLGWMGFATMNEEPPAKPTAPPAPPRRVSVRLLGPAEEITGIKVPKGLARQGDTYLRAQEPADVTVRLPGDRVVQMRVKYASVNVDHGVVVDVHLLPLSKSVSFREAVEELRRLMRAMHIEPDERMRKQMAAWPDDLPTHPPGSNPDLPSASYRTEVKLSESIAFLVKVRPSDEGKYFLTLTFAVDGPARRAVWDPNFKPESKPPAEEKGKEPNPDLKKK
jgi:hypothetical protein